MFGGLTPGHLLVVLVVVVILFGSTKLPKLARSIGGMQHEFRRGVAGDLDDQAS
jgi:sec-independent protein translocase protein TatA